MTDFSVVFQIVAILRRTDTFFILQAFNMTFNKVLRRGFVLAVVSLLSIQCVSKSQSRIPEDLKYVSKEQLLLQPLSGNFFLQLHPRLSFDSVKNLANSAGWNYDTTIINNIDGSSLLFFPAFHLLNVDVPFTALLNFKNGELEYFTFNSLLSSPSKTPQRNNLDAYNQLVSFFKPIYGIPVTSGINIDQRSSVGGPTDTVYTTAWTDSSHKCMYVVEYNALYQLLGLFASNLTDKSLPAARNFLSKGIAIDSSIRGRSH
jgi:hypothetical protein